jgi:hypothetical protein
MSAPPGSPVRQNYPLSKMVRLAFDAITGFSTQPLRIASYLGFLIGTLGIFLLVYTLARWVAGNVIEGWTSLMVVVVTLTSAQLFILGIMGEYLGRLYIGRSAGPLFVVVVEIVAFGRDKTAI